MLDWLSIKIIIGSIMLFEEVALLKKERWNLSKKTHQNNIQIYFTRNFVFLLFLYPMGDDAHLYTHTKCCHFYTLHR